MLGKIANLINGVVGIILLLLSLRFILEIFSIGESSQFAHIVYTSTIHLRDPLIPAYDWLGAMGSEGAAFITFMTMVVYATIGWSISGLLMNIHRNTVKTPKK